MGYEPKNQQDEQYQDGIHSGLSWEQVGTKIGLGWDEVEIMGGNTHETPHRYYL